MLFSKSLKQFWSYAGISIRIGCVLHCIDEYCVTVTHCYGPSMEPTIQSNNIVLCEHISPLFRSLQCGDIVIAKSVNTPIVNVCKRITGVAGDVVWSGNSLIKVPEGHVWLQGDNTPESSDSRNYGPVPAALIRGRVTFKIWPLSEMCIFWPVDSNSQPIP